MSHNTEDIGDFEMYKSIPMSGIKVSKDDELHQLKEELKETKRINKAMEAALLKFQMQGALSIRQPKQYQHVKQDPYVTFGPFSSTNEEEELLPEKMPTLMQAKVKVEAFDGIELYPGLGCDFKTWGLNFLDSLDIVQKQCGFNFPEQIKIKLLQDNLKGAVLDQFLQDCKLWCMDENGNLVPDLIKVMDNLNVIFTTKIRDQDGFKLMKKPKPKERTWNQHYNYLCAVNKAMSGGFDRTILDSMVNDSSSPTSIKI
jgi:hypothetical protein